LSGRIVGEDLAHDQVVEEHAQRRAYLALHEKGGQHRRVPVHSRAAEALDAYLEASGLGATPETPRFQWPLLIPYTFFTLFALTFEAGDAMKAAQGCSSALKF